MESGVNSRGLALKIREEELLLLTVSLQSCPMMKAGSGTTAGWCGRAESGGSAMLRTASCPCLVSHSSFLSFSSLYIETWDVAFSGCRLLSSHGHLDLFPSLRTCLVLAMLWCVWTLPRLLIKSLLSDFSMLGSPVLAIPRVGGTHWPAQLTLRPAGTVPGELAAAWARQNANVAAFIRRALFWTTKLIYIYTDAYIYISFGRGKEFSYN